MPVPYFIEATAEHLTKKWGGHTEAIINSVAIIGGVIVVFLAIASVTNVTVLNKDGTRNCYTLLGESTECKSE